MTTVDNVSLIITKLNQTGYTISLSAKVFYIRAVSPEITYLKKTKQNKMKTAYVSR